MRITDIEVTGWNAAIRGMRNPLESWKRSDSEGDKLGQNDKKLMLDLAKAGGCHRKFMRMINVTMDITAMQPWWSEFDTYKVGTVRNSYSKMHKIHTKGFTHAEFETVGIDLVPYAGDALMKVAEVCQKLSMDYGTSGDKKYWRALIELLPEGYMLTATVQLNYEVLAQMYKWRHDHKLREWHIFCEMIENLPNSEIILTAAGVTRKVED